MNTEADTRTRDLSFIHVLKAKAGMVDEDYRALLSRVTGGRITSSAQATEEERGAIIQALRRLHGEDVGEAMPLSPLPPNPNVSAPQWKYIRNLVSKLQWDVKHFRGFLRHVTGLEHENWLDCGSARKLIAGLIRTSNAPRKGTAMPQRGNAMRASRYPVR